MSVSIATRCSVAALVLLVLAPATPWAASADRLRAPDASPVPKATAVDQVTAWSVDGGGGASTGGGFAMTATVGQPDAGMVTRCGTVVAGGLWGAVVDLQPVFCDGFESSDAGAWSSVAGGTE